MTRSRTKLAILLVAWAVLLTTAPSLLDPPAEGLINEAAPTCFGRAATIVATGRSVVQGTPGVDVMVLSDGAEAEAGDGDDFICGAARAFAGRGDDHILYAGPTRVLDLWGERGNDRIHVASRGSAGDIIGGPGRDSLSGGPGGQLLTGSSGRDVLFGDGGRDRLFGGRGRDRLIGGDGFDVGRGGRGDDRCRSIERAIRC